MNKLERFSRIIGNINQWVGKILCFVTFAIMIIIAAEVVLRYVFNRPTVWGTPLAILLFGVTAIMGGGWVLLHNEHISMDILYGRFSIRGKARTDLVTSLFFFFFCGAMFWYGGDLAWTSVMRGETYGGVFRPIIWPFKLLIPLAAFLIILQGVVKFIRDFRVAMTGREMAEKMPGDKLETRLRE